MPPASQEDLSQDNLLAGRRAWLILGSAFLAFTVGASVMHSYTVFLLAFVADFGWTRAESSLAYSVGQLVGGASSPFVGSMVDRLGVRRMVLLGGALLVLGLVGSAQAGALWQVVFLYGVVMTFGANCVGLLVFVPLISRLFATRRGMAISVLQSANGFGRAASAPASQVLIEGLGWRGAYLVAAAVAAAVLLPLSFLFDRRGGVARAAAAPAAAAVRSWTLGEAVRTPQFWLLFLVYMFTSIGSFLVSLHQIAFAVDVGFDPLYAAGVLGMGSFLAMPGVIATGTLSDYIGREWSALLAYGISIIGVFCAMAITGPGDHMLLWLHACFFGLTWGARGPAITAKTADLFPGPRLGTILGVITIGSGLGAAIGSWAAGFVFDVTGSYRVAFIGSVIAYVAGSVAFYALRRPPRPRAQ
ncbi:MFS transporter [Paracraurococcus lichenis]|uniref:MFS transporter n=1 Tax=Paracraurococcus lichenis TaxID=3064888 RepID=A0ABT9E362_9PROT|nr:MFS transporter [Paracraurococcus sp. LOR1-02]MDO9710587.1 MFS transporter [Paracraurococcus sp. LOR1-02]